MAAQVEVACTEANAVSVWLPEHLAKTHKTTEEGEQIVEAAGDRFRSILESLDPPDDLRAPLEALEEGPTSSSTSRADLVASLKKKIALYGEVGAARCGKELQASILVIEGSSVAAAFHQEGIDLPPRPAGW